MEWITEHFSQVVSLLVSGGFLIMILLANLQVRRQLKAPKENAIISSVKESEEVLIEEDEDGNERVFHGYEVISVYWDENRDKYELVTYEENPKDVGFLKEVRLYETIFGKKKLIDENELKKHLDKNGKPESGGALTLFTGIFFVVGILSFFL